MLPARAVEVSQGGRHAVRMVNGVGGVQCWGSNAAGQLGNGTTVNTNVPVAGHGSGQAMCTQVEAGMVHDDPTLVFTCALLANSTVRCWGATPLASWDRVTRQLPARRLCRWRSLRVFR
jgi:hypothetical protein